MQIWSPYKQPGCAGDLDGRIEDDSRCLYTHEEYISLVLNSGEWPVSRLRPASLCRDPRMMAFFDSLVRREIEGWSSDSDSDLSEHHPPAARGHALRLHRLESSASLPRTPPPTVDGLPTAPSHPGPPAGHCHKAWWRPPRHCPRVRMPRLASSACLPCALPGQTPSWPFPTSLTLKRMPVRWNWTQTSFPGHGLPAPKMSPAAPAAPAALRTRRAERTAAHPPGSGTPCGAGRRHLEEARRPPKPTDTYIGEDNYDYPQIKVDDLSSSPTSSPERSAQSLWNSAQAEHTANFRHQRVG